MNRADYIEEFKRVYENAVRDLGADLGGGSLLDLMADNFNHLSLETIEELLTEAGIAPVSTGAVGQSVANGPTEGRR